MHVILFGLFNNITLYCVCIALAAASSPLGVIGGALAGHGLATLVIYIGLYEPNVPRIKHVHVCLFNFSRTNGQTQIIKRSFLVRDCSLRR